ncbi:MAG: Phosphotransferase [Thermodesulfobacteriota bacterium]|nr:Phosphotransferase [Thermodesulfobacteriota bacterium]
MGHSPDEADVQRLPGDGSRRVFWRIVTRAPGHSFIAMSNPPDTPAVRRENHAYLKIGTHLYRRGIPVPEIHRYDLTSGWFIMEDLGHMTLHDAAASGDELLPMYEKVLAQLFRLQIEGAAGFDPLWCWQTGRYDRTVMLRYEADYFRDAFLGRYLGLPVDGVDLDPAFRHLAETASEADSGFFLHRDFQSRNIMVSQGRIGFVDWQGGRLGPLGYDVASLTIDPYTRLSTVQQKTIYERYLDRVKGHDPAWAGAFERYYPYLAIQRNLQILGAFSHLTQAMHKTYFEAYIPDAVRTLHRLLHGVPDREISRLRDLAAGLLSHKKILDIAGGSR